MNRKSALWFIVSTLVAGCGGAATQCDLVPCPSAASYQVCASSNKITYDYGAQSCSCDKDNVNSADCTACLSNVTAYCDQSSGNGGGGGSAGGGGNGGGGGTVSNASCTASFVGGFDGMFSSCAVSITQTTATSWSITSLGGEIPGTSESWSGFTMVNTGTAGMGEYSESSSTSTTTGAFSGTSHWTAGFGQGTTTGDFALDVTSLGSGTPVNGTTVYQNAHGVITATLVDSTGAQPDLFLTVSF